MIYKGHHYKVTGLEIAPTGKVETWDAVDRETAIERALYTHRLHAGRASASRDGVITCPTCGQIAIVEAQPQ